MIIEKTVNTIWQGQVGVADKYITEAIRIQAPLKLIHDTGIMLIPADQIEQNIKGYSKYFRDRFGKRPPYRLVYFVWRPTVDQGRLDLGANN